MSLALYFASDDTEISGTGVFTNAIIFTLRLDLEETDQVRCYAQADDGFEVTDVELTISGTTANMWELAPDSGGSPGSYESPGDPLQLGTVGDNSGTRVYFWVRASSDDMESIQNDDSVIITAEGIAAAE